eukprot:2487071-Pleurochrysis_carterae.AAC.5
MLPRSAYRRPHEDTFRSLNVSLVSRTGLRRVALRPLRPGRGAPPARHFLASTQPAAVAHVAAAAEARAAAAAASTVAGRAGEARKAVAALARKLFWLTQRNGLLHPCLTRSCCDRWERDATTNADRLST